MLSIRITIKALATAGAAAIAIAIWTNHLTAQDTTQPYPVHKPM